MVHVGMMRSFFLIDLVNEVTTGGGGKIEVALVSLASETVNLIR
jgi:hypothetical protein